MPKIAEFADSVIALVAEELEVTKDQILSRSRVAEVVDARYMAVYILRSHHVYPSRIAAIFNLSVRTVHYVITTFDARIQLNKPLRNNYAKIMKQLCNISETTTK